jgi:hypothetical protein
MLGLVPRESAHIVSDGNQETLPTEILPSGLRPPITGRFLLLNAQRKYTTRDLGIFALIACYK